MGNPSTPTTRTRRQEIRSQVRLRKLAQSTPEQRQRARQRKQQREHDRKAFAAYESTQESISATPDDFQLSLKKRRVSDRTLSTIRSTDELPSPHAASTPHNFRSLLLEEIATESDTTSSLKEHAEVHNEVTDSFIRNEPLERARKKRRGADEVMSEDAVATHSRSSRAQSTNRQENSQKIIAIEANNNSNTPQSGVVGAPTTTPIIDNIATASPDTSSDFHDPGAAEQDFISKLKLVTKRFMLRNKLTMEEFRGLTSQGVSNSKITPGQRTMSTFWKAIERITPDLDMQKKKDLLQKAYQPIAASTKPLVYNRFVPVFEDWIAANKIHPDRLCDLAFALNPVDLKEFYNLHKLTEEDLPIQAILQNCLAPCRNCRMLRDQFRLIAERFMKHESLDEKDFLIYLHGDDQDILELFWKRVEQDEILQDLLEEELRNLASEVYPKSPIGIPELFARASNLRPAATTPQKPDLAGNLTSLAPQVLLSDTEHSPTPTISDNAICAAQPTSPVSLQPQTTPTHTPSPFSPSLDQVSAPSTNLVTPPSKQSRRNIMSSMKRDPTKGGQLSINSSKSEKVDSPRILQSEVREIPAAELEWKNHKMRLPNFSFRSGPLNYMEKDMVDCAVKNFLMEESLTRDQFCEILHDGTRKHRKAYFNSILYCIPERKAKNMREYLKKAYNPFKKRLSFTEKEMDDLTRYVRLHGRSWTLIGKLMNRYREDCQHAFLRYEDAQACKNRNNGPWSTAEIAKFKEAVAMFDSAASINWREISAAMSTRTAAQCFDHSRINTRLDSSYRPDHAKNSKSEAKLAKIIPKPAESSSDTQFKVPGASDLASFVQYLIGKEVDTLDVLPTDLGNFEKTFGRESLVSQLTKQRKKIKQWRSLGAQTTLLRIQENLASQ